MLCKECVPFPTWPPATINHLQKTKKSPWCRMEKQEKHRKCYCCSVTCLQYPVTRHTFITICLTHSNCCSLQHGEGNKHSRGFCERKPPFLLSTKKRANLCLSVFQCRHQREQQTQREPGRERTAKTAHCELHCYFMRYTPVTFSATYMGNS